MSDQLTSKAGTITSGEDRFMEWKTKDGNYENTQFAQFDTFFEGMFQKERLLDLIKNFFTVCLYHTILSIYFSKKFRFRQVLNGNFIRQSKRFSYILRLPLAFLPIHLRYTAAISTL